MTHVCDTDACLAAAKDCPSTAKA